MIYSEICQNRTLSKPKTCLNQTDFTVLSTKCLCNLNLCKPKTCLSWTNYSVSKRFGLDRFYCIYIYIYIYSQTCIKSSPSRQRKYGLIRQVTHFKRFMSYEIVCNRTKNWCPFITGDCLIEVTAWAGLTVLMNH